MLSLNKKILSLKHYLNYFGRAVVIMRGGGPACLIHGAGSAGAAPASADAAAAGSAGAAAAAGAGAAAAGSAGAAGAAQAPSPQSGVQTETN